MVKQYPEGNAEARFKMQGVRKIYCFCNKDGLLSISVKKGVDDKEAVYSDSEIRRKQEQIMDVLYEFGEVMDRDPKSEVAQHLAKELHDLNNGQRKAVIRFLTDKKWKRSIDVAGGEGCLEFVKTAMCEFYKIDTKLLCRM
ncbi:MAG: hypothetical protein ACI4SQ_06170 [Eubacterium sp.]